MDGGNKYQLALDASLDTSTNDMLVPANQNTWSHNWQKYQGKYLANSVRFEKNGWAAGWNVFNFIYNDLRLEFNEKWYSLSRLNNNPTYILTEYNSENDYNSLNTYIVTPYSKLLSVTGGTVDFNGSTSFTGTVNNKAFTLTWDPVLETVSVSGNNISLDAQQNIDKSYKLVVTDDSSAFSVDNVFELPSELTCSQLTSSFSYSGCTNGVHLWTFNDLQFIFDENNSTVVGLFGSEKPVTVSNNTITFNYDTTLNEKLSLTYSLETYYVSFSSLNITDMSGNIGDLLIDNGAETDQEFNKLSIQFTRQQPDLTRTNSVMCAVKGTKWHVAAIKTDRDYSKGILKPDNVEKSFKLNRFRAGNFVDINIVNTFSYDIEADASNEYRDNSTRYLMSQNEVTCPVDSELESSQFNDLNYRYNRIEVRNNLVPGKYFNIRKSILNNEVWFYSARRFSNLRNNNLSVIQKAYGLVFSILGNFVFSAFDYFSYNNWCNFTDPNNAFYTARDLALGQSIKLKGTADSWVERDDLDFVEENKPADSTIITRSFRQNSALTLYDSSDPDTQTPYDSNGNYIAGTYEKVELSLDSGPDFWPFEYVPRFNYNGQACYYMDNNTVITDLDLFKRLVLGEYDASVDMLNDIVTENIQQVDFEYHDDKYRIENDTMSYFADKHNCSEFIQDPQSGYNFQRVVIRHNYLYDFEIDAFDNELFSKYYPNSYNFNLERNSEPVTVNPLSNLSRDNRYLTYDNVTEYIDIIDFSYMSMPGVVIKRFQSGDLSCFNQFNDLGLVLYDLTGTPHLHVYDGENDVTDTYNKIIEDITSGTLEWSGSSDYHIDLPSYFGGLDLNSDLEGSGYMYSGLFTKTSVNNSEHKFVFYVNGTGPSWHCNWYSAPAKVTPGSVKVYAVKNSADGHCFSTIALATSRVRKTDGATDPTAVIEATSSFTTEDLPPVTYTTEVEPDDSIVYNMSDTPVVTVDGVVMSVAKSVGHIFSIKYPALKTLTDFSEDPLSCITLENYNFNSLGLSFRVVSADPSDNVTIAIDSADDPKIYYSKLNYSLSTGRPEHYAYYYHSKAGLNGNLVKPEGVDVSGNNNLINFKVQFTPNYYEIPYNFEPVSLIENQIPHILYNNLKDLLDNIVITEGTFNPNSLNYQIQLTLNNTIVPLTYNITSKTFSLNGNRTVNTGYDATITFNNITHSENRISIGLLVNLLFNNVTGKFLKSDNDTLLSFNGSVAVVRSGSNNLYNYNFLDKSVTGVSNITINTDANTEHIIFDKSIHCDITAILSNVVGGMYRDVNINSFFNSELQANIKVSSVDIRTPDKTDIIEELDSLGEYQLVKQLWDSTTNVENFWWVNSTHALVLTQTSFILKRKTNELDDWNGNIWKDIYNVSKANILKPDVRYFTVTNVYNTNRPAVLFTVHCKDTNTLQCDIYNPLSELDCIGTVYFDVKLKEIGDTLNVITHSGSTAYFNTYSQINAYQLLTQAQWSSTIVDNRLIIGCHLSNNFDQWSAIFNLNSLSCERVIQGYGYVGLHGDLTGGMIPSTYFDITKGFNNKVKDVSSLSKVNDNNDLDKNYIIPKAKIMTSISGITSTVVGTAEKQWYISKELTGIVSHISYSEGEFKAVKIPITNNYSAIYGSTSFLSSVFADTDIESFNMADLFGNKAGGLRTALSIVSPRAYWYAPRLSKLVYLQQTLGQYAYVHHNESDNKVETSPEDTSDKNPIQDKKDNNNILLTDDLSFDKQIIEQVGKITKSPEKTNVLGMLAAIFAPAVNMLSNPEFSLNDEIKQLTILDTGRKFAQASLENVGSIAVTSLVTKSADAGLTSKVTGIKSLDMFYSTSDKQNIFAGPGFVEHQFTANCVAQSVTDVHAHGMTQQLTMALKMLTVFQTQLEAYLLDMAAYALDQSANAIANQMVCANTLGAVGAAMHVTAGAMRAANGALKIVAQNIDQMVDSLGGGQLRSEVVAYVSKDNLSAEGKHKYGEKNEYFMWPCWGIPASGIKYCNERVQAGLKKSTWELNLKVDKKTTNKIQVVQQDINMGTLSYANTAGKKLVDHLEGDASFYQAACYGESESLSLPEDMACIQGVQSFLPSQAFKNENIDTSAVVSTPSLFHDYVIDKSWEISQCCTYGLTQWVTCKDTKLINCAPSNMVITDNFCGIAAPYTVIEVKRGLTKSYMRPWAITPNVLALNCTGRNAIYDNKLYHAFDGISYRITEWTGAAGLNKNNQTFLYSFQVNDRFKRSNKFPANELQGNFKSDPCQSVETIDTLHTIVTVAAKQKGIEGGTIGEDKDATRWAIPIFTEQVNTLPAAVKTLTAMPLQVHDGITSLCIDIANNQAAYKAPKSVDFTIGKNVYRVTDEYICSVETQDGIDIVTDLVPSLGLKYLGASPLAAYFYSEITRCYYMFSGNNLTKLNMLERFRDIKGGYWDFVNQAIVMPCLMSFMRLDKSISDKDTETDNIIVPTIANSEVSGELPPPLTTIFNDKSWYKVVALPSGLVYQGPNRVIINRNIVTEYMLSSIKANLGMWDKLDKEQYTTHRTYKDKFVNVMTDVYGVEGWTHNPFILVTSPLGLSESADCMFEWTITFCWTAEMDKLYNQNNYAVVNLVSETMTVGGKVTARPTHVYLTKELFTRSGNFGYYSFKYQGKNGSGNRERLFIWSDQYIAMSSVECEIKTVSQNSNTVLTQQLDMNNMKEL